MMEINVFWGMVLCWQIIVTSVVEELAAFNFCIQAAYKDYLQCKAYHVMMK
jgi:hypothetical protein